MRVYNNNCMFLKYKQLAVNVRSYCVLSECIIRKK